MFLKLIASLSFWPTADDGDHETRRRHRLSKPLTNKSSMNLLALSQQSESVVNGSSGVDVSSASLSGSNSRENVLDVIQSPLSCPQPEMIQDQTSIVKGGVSTRTTFILGGDPIQDVDSPTLVSPQGSVKTKRPLSAIFAPRLSGGRAANDFARRRISLQALAAGVSEKAENSNSAVTLPSSSEFQSDALSPRLQRRSSFTPGVATRTSRKASLGPSPMEEQPDADRDHSNYATLSEESSLRQLQVLDFDEDWTPPAPPLPRSETPSDLDYTHLGGLRLGSLRVMNGRASPAPSELSRHLNGASTPNLKRTASSNYSDGEEGTVLAMASLYPNPYRGRDLGLQDLAFVPRKPVGAPARTHSDTIVVPKRGNPTVYPSHNGMDPNSASTSAPKVDAPLPPTVSHSPDKTSELAMAYMAELCTNPYSEERPASPTGSVLRATSKATEFDDHLFEDDGDNLSISEEAKHLAPDAHYSSNNTVWMYEDAYSLSVKRSRDTSPRSSLQPSNSTGSSASVTPDSGYGSKVSLQSMGKRTPNAAAKTENPVTNRKAAQVEEMHVVTTPGRPGPRPSSTPPRPSILRQSGTSAPQLPTLPNLYSSTTTLATIASTGSAPADAPGKLRKLRKKRRPRSQSSPVRHIVIQGQQRDVSNSDIPPIPPEVATNLAVRTQQVPALGHTFSGMEHTRQIESSARASDGPTRIVFPTSDPSLRDSLTEMNLPTPPPHRSSFIRWSKMERRNSERRTSNPSGVSKEDAMAIIQDHSTAVSSMGGSPYDVASHPGTLLSSQSPLSKTPTNSHTPSHKSLRPRQMMDDATAAELARLRSRTIVERDDMQSKHGRGSFNDRGGMIPGRNIRPLSMAGDAPPLPTLPSHEQARQREVQKVDYPRLHLETGVTKKYWPEPCSFDSNKSAAPAAAAAAAAAPPPPPPPPPPSHPPPPKPTGLVGDIPPLPPSQSPTKRSIETRENTMSPLPPSHSSHPRSVQPSDETSAPPPPSHSPRPISIMPQENVADIWAAHALAWKSRRKSIGEMLRSRNLPPEEQQYEESAIDDPIYPAIPVRPHRKSFTTGYEGYGNSGSQFHGAQPGSMSHEPPTNSRPWQPPSLVSRAGGLAYPPYEYEARFGGSTGIGSASSIPSVTRTGMPLSKGFGATLSEVPIATTIRRKPVGFQ